MSTGDFVTYGPGGKTSHSYGNVYGFTTFFEYESLDFCKYARYRTDCLRGGKSFVSILIRRK